MSFYRRTSPKTAARAATGLVEGAAPPVSDEPLPDIDVRRHYEQVWTLDGMWVRVAVIEIADDADVWPPAEYEEARRSALGPDDRAILFADQNKAFERLSFAWLAKVLRRWGFPPWIHHGLLALTMGRAVKAARGGPSPPVRTLARSIGMGGTASPLTWNIGYDPIIHVTSRGAGAATPTSMSTTSRPSWPAPGRRSAPPSPWCSPARRLGS